MEGTDDTTVATTDVPAILKLWPWVELLVVDMFVECDSAFEAVDQVRTLQIANGDYTELCNQGL